VCTGKSCVADSVPVISAKSDFSPKPEINMSLNKPKKDRLPPPEVPALERNGIRYEQSLDGRSVGADQVGGVLVAINAQTGTRLWTLPVYPNPIDPKLETDVQWIFFVSMVFDDDGRLRIVNQRRKTYLVDVNSREVKLVD
jgi:hypothetical protein